MKKLFLILGVLVLVGSGCSDRSLQSKSDSNVVSKKEATFPSTTDDQQKIIFDKRAANAVRYMGDKNFVAFIKKIQPSDCRGTTPNVSSIIESDLTGDDKKELVVDATSCHAYSSGSDMNFVVQVDANSKYSVLKIDDQTFVGYYTGLEVSNNTLVQQTAIHNPGDAGAGPTGGIDLVYFKWNGSEFVTDKTDHTSTWLSPQE